MAFRARGVCGGDGELTQGLSQLVEASLSRVSSAVLGVAMTLNPLSWSELLASGSSRPAPEAAIPVQAYQASGLYEDENPPPWGPIVMGSGLTTGSGDPLGPADNGPRNYVRPDVFILDDVAKALAFDPLVDAWTLDVECTSGHVKVSGRVPLATARRRVEVLIAAVFGVRRMDISEVIVAKGITPPDKQVSAAGADDEAEQGGPRDD
jgi:hypothetical protein